MEEEITAQALCLRYGVAVYPVDGHVDNPPPEAAGKFFVSTLAGDFDDVVGAIPLADSEEEAEMLAVARLKLRELYAAQVAK